MIALVTILPLALVVEGRTIVAGTLATIEAVGLAKFARMLLLCGLSHYIYNECAFVALSSIHPVRRRPHTPGSRMHSTEIGCEPR